MIPVRAASWLFAGIAAVAMMGLIDLGTVFGLSDPRYQWPMSQEASWGALFTFLVAGGFGWIATVPHRPWPGLVLLVMVTVSLLLGGAVLVDVGPVWLALGLAAATGTVWLLLRPGRFPDRLRLPHRPAATAVALAGVALWLGYAWNSYAAAVLTYDLGDVTNGINHWPVQVALGLALAAGCSGLVLWPAPLMLWRVGFALTAGIVAYATLVFPDRLGAMPHPAWGWTIAAWGALILWPGQADSALPPRPVTAATASAGSSGGD